MTFGFYKTWIDILLYKTKPADIADTSLGEGLKHLVIATIIVGALSGIYFMLAWEQITSPVISANPGIVGAIVSAITTPILAVILAFISTGIFWVIAKIFGGKGSYGKYLGTLALINAALIGTVQAAFSIIGIVAALAGAAVALFSLLSSFPVNIIQLILFVYGIFLFVKATQAVHRVSVARAVAIVLVTIIIITVITLVVLLAQIVAFLPTLMR